MLSKPSDGWAYVKVGSFKDRASYLTDIPMDLLDAFIYSFKNCCPASIKFDAEGWEYILVIDYYDTYIITDKEDYSELIAIEVSKKELAKELYNDISDNIDEWVNWLSYTKPVIERKQVLESKLIKLSELIKKTNKRW